ncbi:DUF6471 domain-containing protein [Rhodopila sp.]|uniref:DUF6471 domain-containing protein n=1 Tax=Rhodopila sp. TaxID=2480087 RepID=UPI003D12E661
MYSSTRFGGHDHQRLDRGSRGLHGATLAWPSAAWAACQGEKEWGTKASRFLKAESKRAGIGYRELAEQLNKQGMAETETSIAGKLAPGTFAACFFVATLAALEMEGVRLEDLSSISNI